MEISEKLKQRFCKDMNISIQLYQEPFFLDRIKLMGYEEIYNEFVYFIKDTFKNEEEYFAYYNDLKDRIIDYIKNSDAYLALQNDTSILNKSNNNIKQGDTYKESCIGKQFLSIDMKKANFSALVKYGKERKETFFKNYNYEEFIKQFTPYDYFAKSKYIRQVVFGNCNPKRQIAYETYLMSKVINLITRNSHITNLIIDDVYSLNSDEIIFDITNKEEKDIDYNLKSFLSMTELYDLPLRVESFKIGKLEGTKAYVKLFENGSYELKCVNPYEAPFIYRFMKNKIPSNLDRYFLYEGKLAKFEDIPDIKLVIETDKNKIKENEYEELEN